MWICKAYGREFVANTEDACWDLVEEFEDRMGMLDLSLNVEQISGEF